MKSQDTDIPIEPPRPEPGAVRIGLAITVSCAFFMENFDGTVLATALPSVARSLGTTAIATSIGITAYLVSLAMFISLSGWLADRFGTRTVFSAAILLFAVASLGCALADRLSVFAAARALQGIGGAMMVPVGRLIVVKTTARVHFVRAMALVTTPALLGASLGPPIGGFLSTYFSWRAIFLINLPVAVVGIILIHLTIPNLREEARAFDWTGFILSGGAVGLSMLGLQGLTHEHGDVWQAAIWLVPGLILLWATLSHARRHPEGLIDLSLIRFPTFASVATGGGLFFVSIASMPFLLPLLLQIGFGMTAFVSGMVTLASALGGLFVKRLAPGVLRRFGYRHTLIATSLGVASAMLLCALTTGYIPTVLTGVLLFGFGLLRSLQFSSLNTMVYADVPPERTSRATSLADTLKQLWQGVGVTISAVLLRELGQFLPHQASPKPYQLAMALMALLGASAILSFRRLPPEAGALLSGHAPGAAAETEEPVSLV
jgi:MFS family permease